MKIYRILGMCVVTLLALAACSSDPTLAGEWTMVSIGDEQEMYSGDQLEELGRAGETIEFTEDGEVSWNTNDATETGSYEYDPESGELNLDVTNQDGQSAQYEFVVSELTADALSFAIPDFLVMEFERQ